MKQLIQIELRSFFTFGVTRALRSHLDSDDKLRVEVDPGTDVEGLIQKLSLLGPGVSLDDVVMFVYVNDRQSTLDYVLQPGDILDLHVPAMGG